MSEDHDRRPSLFSRAYAFVRPYIPGTACAASAGLVLYVSLMTYYDEDKDRRARAGQVELELRRKKRNLVERLWYHGKKNVQSTIDTTVNFLSNDDTPRKDASLDSLKNP